MFKKMLSYFEGDKVIWTVAVMLSIVSLVAVYSVSSINAFGSKQINPFLSVLNQLVILVSGLSLMFVVHKIKYTKFSRIAQLLLYFGIVLLLITLFFGPDRSSARRWLSIPIINMSFQTSDFVKVALILYLSRILVVKNDILDNFKSMIKPILLPIIIILALIALNSNTVALMVMVIPLLMMLFAGVSHKVFGKFLLVLVAFFLLFHATSKIISPSQNRTSTLKNRIAAFVMPDKQQYDDSQKIRTAIVMGGVFGQGPGNCTQKTFLKNIESDYIYALLIEEYGIIGGLVILLLYVILAYRGIRVAVRAPSLYSSLLAFGVTVMICFQAFIHMMVIVGAFPITGQPLPFVSMGGTSIWISFIALGILLSVSKTVDNYKVNQ